MISPAAKDIIDIVGALGTPIAILGGLYGAWKFMVRASIVGHDRAKEAETAIAQINLISTNHIPHMAAAMEEVKMTNAKALEILGNIDKGIAILVDRDKKVSNA